MRFAEVIGNAEVAKALGRTSLVAEYERRGKNYQNIFDPESGFMRGRDKDGNPQKVLFLGGPLFFCRGLQERFIETLHLERDKIQSLALDNLLYIVCKLLPYLRRNYGSSCISKSYA
mgnify:CR=1 FL=1